MCVDASSRLVLVTVVVVRVEYLHRQEHIAQGVFLEFLVHLDPNKILPSPLLPVAIPLALQFLDPVPIPSELRILEFLVHLDQGVLQLLLVRVDLQNRGRPQRKP